MSYECDSLSHMSVINFSRKHCYKAVIIKQNRVITWVSTPYMIGNLESVFYLIKK